MGKQLLTVTLPPAATPTVASVAAHLGLTPDEIDREFGVVAVEPDRARYAIMVEASAAARLAGTEGVSGPYANPRIEPFGPA